MKQLRKDLEMVLAFLLTVIAIGAFLLSTMTLAGCAGTIPGAAKYSVVYEDAQGTRLDAQADVKNESDMVELEYDPATKRLHFVKKGTKGIEAQEAYLGILQSQARMFGELLQILLLGPLGATPQAQSYGVTPQEIYDSWKRGDKAL